MFEVKTKHVFAPCRRSTIFLSDFFGARGTTDQLSTQHHLPSIMLQETALKCNMKLAGMKHHNHNHKDHEKKLSF